MKRNFLNIFGSSEPLLLTAGTTDGPFLVRGTECCHLFRYQGVKFIFKRHRLYFDKSLALFRVNLLLLGVSDNNMVRVF